MKEDVTKIFNLLNISDLISYEDFQNEATLGASRYSPWYLKNPKYSRGRKVRPRPTFRGKQDLLHKQLYRFFRGELPTRKLVPFSHVDDYNPWHWKEAGVTIRPIADPETEELPEELEGLADTIKQRTLHGNPNPWFEVDEFYSPEEIEQVKRFLDAK